jgi:hypothetical protein
MATAFTNAVANNVGTADAVVYTAPSGVKAILIGCNVANKTGSILPINLILRKTGGDTYIVKGKRVDNGTSEELMRGNKLVLLPGDAIVAISGLDNGFDVVASILTGVA